MTGYMYFSRQSSLGLLFGLLICVIHGILLCLTFPLTELLSEVPLLYIDSPYHLYQVSVAQELWLNYQHLVGYNPWFGAGHVGGVNVNQSARVPALLSVLFTPTLSPIVVYKLYVFVPALLAPAFVLLAMHLLKFDAVTMVVATLLGFLLWWISAFHWFHIVGMVSFVGACYAALSYIALTWRSVTEPLTFSIMVALAVFGAIGVLYHTMFPILVIFTMPFLLLAAWKQVKLNQLLIVLLIIPALCILPNIIWLLPVFKYPGWGDGDIYPFQKVVDAGIIWSEALGRIDGVARGARINPVLWFCVMWSLFFAANTPLYRLSIGFVVSAVILVVFSAVGAWWPVMAVLQPNRLSHYAYLLLVVPAGIGISTIIVMFGRRGLVGHLAKGSVILLLAASVFFILELKNEVSSDDTAHHGGRPSPEVRGPGETTLWLTDWLKRNTTDEARVLFETSYARIHDKAHVAGFLAMETKREFIGGPYISAPPLGFWDGMPFGRPISEFSTDEFSDQLKLYNIGWIIVHFVASKAYLDQHPLLELVAQHGQLNLYKVNQEHSYFLEGRGRVTQRKLNRIDLSEITGEAVTLKYHFVDGMISDPPTILLPVIRPGDPVPFIRVLAPPRKMSIIFP